jgi:hypothetical protein
MKSMTLLATISGQIVLTSLPIHGAQEQFFEGLGSYTRTVTTGSPDAEK